MRKTMIILFLCIQIILFSNICSAQNQIEFDGYWWATATPEQKLGYVQGFIDGAGGMSVIFLNLIAEAKMSSSDLSSREKNQIRNKIGEWIPYNRKFGYYLDRIDGFYRTTLSMKTPVGKIMMDLMESPK